MLGHAQAVEDSRVTACGVKTGGTADLIGCDARHSFHGLWRIFRAGGEVFPFRKSLEVTAFLHEGVIDQSFGDDDMGEGRQYGDIGARLQFEVIVGTYVRRIHEIDFARVDHDEPGALPDALFHARPENGVAVGRVGADDQNDIAFFDGLEALCAGRFTQRLLETITRRRMANPGTRIDVVVAEGSAHEFLNQIIFFVRTAAGNQCADGVHAVTLLNIAEAVRGIA